MFPGHLQMPVILVCRELRQQGAEGGLRIADQTEIDLGPATKLLTPDVDLDDRRILGKELPLMSLCAGVMYCENF